MIDYIEFPRHACESLKKSSRETYYNTHFKYILHLLTYKNNAKIKYINSSCINNFSKPHYTNFVVNINGKNVIFDYSDHLNSIDEDSLNELPCFKFHYTSNLSNSHHPFPPMSFFDWNSYFKLISKRKNTKDFFLYRTHYYGRAINRRNMVKQNVLNIQNKSIKTDLVNQIDYFNDIYSASGNIIVPGAREDIVDRSHMQSFGLNCLVISPKIRGILPGNLQWISGEDYLEFDISSFENLNETLEFALTNPKICKEISENAFEKFYNTCTPLFLQKYILSKIDEKD